MRLSQILRRLPTTKIDDRWQNLNMFPITASLLTISLTNTILSACDYNLRNDLLPYICAITSSVTIIHTSIELFLIPRKLLDPIYVTIISCFLFILWAGTIFLLAMDIFFAILSFGCIGWIYDKDGLHKVPASCTLLRARAGLSAITLILYLASLVVSAMALKRYQRLGFQRQPQSRQSATIEDSESRIELAL